MKSSLFLALLFALVGCSKSSDSAVTMNDETTDAGMASNMSAPSGVADQTRRYRFTYDARIPAPPLGSADLRVWIPLPLEDPGVQSNGEVKIDVEPEAGATWRVTTDPVYGNRMIYVEKSNPASGVRVKWSTVVTRHADVGQGRLTVHDEYLRPNRLIPLDDKAAVLVNRLDVANASLARRTRAKPHLRRRSRHDGLRQEDPGLGPR